MSFSPSDWNGVVIGSPAGGPQGHGTLNCSGIYINGSKPGSFYTAEKMLAAIWPKKKWRRKRDAQPGYMRGGRAKGRAGRT
jgi:hypothetical protein